MSRRKQAKPRSFKHDENETEENNLPTSNLDKENEDNSNIILEGDAKSEGDDEEDENEEEEEEENEENGITNDEPAIEDTTMYSNNEYSSDSEYSDIYSSQTSSSFSPSISDGKATPTSMHSYDAATDQQHHDLLNGMDKQEKLLLKASVKKDRGIKEKAKNIDGSYQCPFCDKSFPRLGYLKKHEQSHVEHMPFKCEYCQRLFKHKRSRDRHTKLHTGDRRYKCPHCEAAFSRSDHLKIHMKTHDNQKPFQCTICNRGYNTAAALTSHMQNHKKQVALTGSPNLTYSPRSISSNSSVTSLTQKRKYGNNLDPNFNHKTNYDYINYARSPSTGILSCIYCTKSDFTTIDQLHLHVHAMHGGILRGENKVDPRHSPNMPIACEFCTMKCPSLQILYHHLKATHMDRIGSPNTYLEQFNRHLRSTYDMKSVPQCPSVTDSRPLVDDVKMEVQDGTPKHNGKDSAPPSKERIKVEKSDSEEQLTPTDLSQPKEKRLKVEAVSDDTRSEKSPIVEPRKPTPQHTPVLDQFLCNQCNAALPDFESFRNHLRSHLDQPASSFLCQHCAVTFSDPVEYERHVITHFLVTNSEFTCTNTCNKAFAKPDELQKHLFDLHALTLYKCSICAEVFDTKVAIQVHFAVAHSNEVKLFRCSACAEIYRSERDFRNHIRSRHINPGAVQCVFCRVICSSELEMHFHLAAHARQFRCPACPESFHVEFLLDRHLETHHREQKSPIANNNNNNNISSNNNNISLSNNNHLDYQHQLAKSASFYNYTSKFYNPTMSIDGLNGLKHPNLLHGIYDSISKSQRYLDGAVPTHPSNIASNGEKTSPNKSAVHGMYGPGLYPLEQQPSFQDRMGRLPNKNPYYNNVLSKSVSSAFNHPQQQPPAQPQPTVNKPRTFQENKGFSCGMCERQDFSTESEVHTHRKIVHNLKTGVSLRCAYCNGDYRSRSELENHMKITHNTNGKHKCLICDEIFPSPAVLAEHKLTHCKVGPSGRCSHCFIAIPDQSAFKGHLFEHNGSGEVPAQCICCRQTLSSEFEINLHAKFHTKSTEPSTHTCALCLESLPAHASPETKICEGCLKKHNFPNKFLPLNNFHPTVNIRPDVHFGCNICKKTLASGIKLQEHLIEHTFAGCEERGYICYICSSVFTSSSGLLLHIQEHGAHNKPYDCSYCDQKYFFRAELDHHLVDHEIYSVAEHERRGAAVHREANKICHEEVVKPADVKMEKDSSLTGSEKSIAFVAVDTVNVKLEGSENIEGEDEEEYIEVEKIHEAHNGKPEQLNEVETNKTSVLANNKEPNKD